MKPHFVVVVLVVERLDSLTVYRQLFVVVFEHLVVAGGDGGVVVDIVDDIESLGNMRKTLVVVVDIELVVAIESRTNELARVVTLVEVVAERMKNQLALVVEEVVVERTRIPLALVVAVVAFVVVAHERMMNGLLVVVVVERTKRNLELVAELVLVVVVEVVVGRKVVVVVVVVVGKMMNLIELAVVERTVATSLVSTLVEEQIVVGSQNLVLACILVDSVVHMKELVRIVDRMLCFCNFYRPFF